MRLCRRWFRATQDLNYISESPLHLFSFCLFKRSIRCAFVWLLFLTSGKKCLYVLTLWEESSIGMTHFMFSRNGSCQWQRAEGLALLRQGSSAKSSKLHVLAEYLSPWNRKFLIRTSDTRRNAWLKSWLLRQKVKLILKHYKPRIPGSIRGWL